MKLYIRIVDNDWVFGLTLLTALFSLSWTGLEALGVRGSPSVFISLVFASAIVVTSPHLLRLAKWNVINWSIDKSLPYILNYKPAVIIGVGRGGAHIAAMFCHKLSEFEDENFSEPYFVSIDRVYFFKEGTVRTKIPEFSRLNFDKIREAGNVLLVTAEVRTGKTMKAALKLLKKNGIEPKTFALTTTSFPAYAEIKVNYYIVKTKSRSLLPWRMSRIHRAE